MMQSLRACTEYADWWKPKDDVIVLPPHVAATAAAAAAAPPQTADVAKREGVPYSFYYTVVNADLHNFN
jgi:hypothetical protein